jgi:phosphoribosyl 1,2-cyclic phosphate phosphodiesterase
MNSTLTILGSGTSTGIPRIVCDCRVCRSREPKNKRTRASIWIKTPSSSLLIDTSPDLRAQAIREKLQHIDAVLYTHTHADHLHGIDELRSFNFAQKSRIPIYGTSRTLLEIRQRFQYIFNDGAYEGGGKPLLDPQEISSSAPHVLVHGEKIIPLPLEHGSGECTGFRLGSVAYITDTSYIPPQSLERIRGLSVLVLDCLQIEPHRTHLNLKQALEVIDEVRPARTVLTHLGHDFDFREGAKLLPRGVSFAYDGLKIRFNSEG